MLKKIIKFLELQILVLLKELEIKTKTLNEADIKKQWDLETGEKFNNLICRYAISEDELLSISETVCKFVTMTRITNIDKYLFKDKELTKPILPDIKYMYSQRFINCFSKYGIPCYKPDGQPRSRNDICNNKHLIKK